MEDLLLFVFAVWFSVVTIPIWLTLGLFYGVIIAVIRFFGYALQIFTGYFKYEEYREGIISLIFAIPMSIWDGMKAFVEPVSYAWEFARYEHPFWAFFISLVLVGCYSDDDG